MIRLAAAAAVTWALALTPLAFAQDTVSDVTIRAIENQMIMPRRARPLELYDRYYASDQADGREIIVGVFLLRKTFGARTWAGAQPVAAITNAFTTSRAELPVIADGGCSVVRIYFDMTTARLLPIQIEGVEAEPELGACNGGV